MNKTILWLVAIFLVGAVEVVEAQQPKKLSRIGVLLPWSPDSGVSLSFLKAFRQGRFLA